MREGASNAAGVYNREKYELDLNRILCGEDCRTTLIIKNIPANCTSEIVLAAIDEHHRGTYDFFDLPHDSFCHKKISRNAFINMTASIHIVSFYQAFNGKKWDQQPGNRRIKVEYARMGKDDLVAQRRHLDD